MATPQSPEGGYLILAGFACNKKLQQRLFPWPRRHLWWRPRSPVPGSCDKAAPVTPRCDPSGREGSELRDAGASCGSAEGLQAPVPWPRQARPPAMSRCVAGSSPRPIAEDVVEPGPGGGAGSGERRNRPAIAGHACASSHFMRLLLEVREAPVGPCRDFLRLAVAGYPMTRGLSGRPLYPSRPTVTTRAPGATASETNPRSAPAA